MLGIIFVIFFVIVFFIIYLGANNNHPQKSPSKISKKTNNYRIILSDNRESDKRIVLESISKENTFFDYSFLHKKNSFLLNEVEDIDVDIEYKNKISLNRIFRSMMKLLYYENYNSQLSQLPIDILYKPEVLIFIKKHTDILNSSLKYVILPLKTKRLFKKSSYIYSGFKTWHELNEAYCLLSTDKTNKKSLDNFLSEVEQINDIYNKKYLKAEYLFAEASGQMASNWLDYVADGDDYYLQYRTVNDGQVRQEHAALHGVTLPPSDAFWDVYYPPNGWNCRCTVIQVLKRDASKTIITDLDNKTKENLFSFNSGKDKTLFPFYNIYTFNPCKVCKQRFLNENHILCKVCSILNRLYEEQMVVKRKSTPPQILN